MSTEGAGKESGAGAELKVGEWTVDPTGNRVIRDGQSTRLEPKAIEVLVYLVQHAGRVVPREELLSRLWPDVVVGDDALTQSINKLRKAFGDEAQRPTYIRTISKRGYQLIAPVARGKSPEQQVTSAAPTPDAPARGRSLPRRRRWLLGTGAALLALLALGVLLSLKSGSEPGSSVARSPDVGLPPMIAVLPLSNQSGDSKREYFSDGMTEDIINALGRYSGLRVISRNSVGPFRGESATAPLIREQLGARYVLTGSVREADGRLRVSFELSDAERGSVIWSERYEGAGSDVFDLQDRVARDIAGTLAVKVSRLELERARRKPPATLEGYDLVLHARALLIPAERDANRQARSLAGKALEVWPDYSEAHVVLAEAEYQRFVNGWTENPEESLRRAEQHALRALAVDDPGANARAHGQLGLIYSAYGKFDLALAEADKAIELNPSDAHALDTRGSTLMWLGRPKEAIAALETAFRFNPQGRDPQSAFHRALTYYTLGRYPEALATTEAAVARYPNALNAHVVRAATLAQTGNGEEARRAAADVSRLDPFFSRAEFGNRFVDPRHAAHLRDGLQKAGL